MISNKKKLFLRQLIKRGDCSLEPFLPEPKASFTTMSGRGGLELCFDLLGLMPGDTVFLPAFVPEGVYSPCKNKGLKIVFYDIQKNLLIDMENFAKGFMENPGIKAAVVIHYFGIPQPIAAIKNICMKHGALLIEDCAQALFSVNNEGKCLGKVGDVALFSLSKSIPVPDGAYFFLNCKGLNFKDELKHGNAIKNELYILCHLMSLLMGNSRNLLGRWSKAFYKLSSMFYNISYQLLRTVKRPGRMSFWSKRIMTNLNYPAIIDSKKRLLKIFLARIDRNKIDLVNKDLDLNNVLMGIPIYVKDRTRFLKRLRRAGIMASTFYNGWNFLAASESREFNNSFKMLNELVLLPLDYEMNDDNLNYMVDVLNHLGETA